ncbi:hypothetical protein ACFSCU_09050 [Ottowia beijingensis]
MVFDEASQVGLAHALALMPLGRSYLFAGDPQQLSPVVRSSATLVQRWLGSSPFSKKPAGGSSVCFLDEQSRMAEPICGLVSHLFYDGLAFLHVVPSHAEPDGGGRHLRGVSFVRRCDVVGWPVAGFGVGLSRTTM